MLASRRQQLLEAYPEYSGPEWGCSECYRLKADLEQSEETDNKIRNHLDEILNIHKNYVNSGNHQIDFTDYFKIIGLVRFIAIELGVYDYTQEKAVI